jgi:hypothetical protein
MIDQLIIALGAILVLGLIWVLLKAVLKLTLKVFSCGLFLILAVGALIYLATNFDVF